MQAKVPVYIKLFVGQIPKTYTENDLRGMFEPFGTVQDVTVLRYRDSDLSRGCGFVGFTRKEDADQAVKSLHNTIRLDGVKHLMQVKYADGELEKLETQIYVGRIPPSATEDELRELFSPWGTIEEVKILRKPDGSSKGCAFIKYYSRDEATQAIANMSGKTTMSGASAPLIVNFPDKKEKTKTQSQQQSSSSSHQSLLVTPQYYQQPLGSHSSVPSYNSMGGVSPYYQYNYQVPSQPSYSQMPLLPQPHSYSSPLGSNSGYNSQYQNQYGGSYDQKPYGAGKTIKRKTEVGDGDSNVTSGPPGSNLFIFNLPPEFTKEQLADLFVPYGNILSASIFIDKNTGVSKCFGFVSYGDPQQAQSAIQGMNGFELAGKTLRVSLKRKDASYYQGSDNDYQYQSQGYQSQGYQTKRVRY